MVFPVEGLPVNLTQMYLDEMTYCPMRCDEAAPQTRIPNVHCWSYVSDKIRNHYKGSKIRITLLIEYLKPRTLCLRFESLQKQDRSCLASMILVDQISQDKNT